MKKSKKQYNYYVVFEGRVPGIYHSYKNVQHQTEGFSGSSVKGFSSYGEAKNAYQGLAGEDADCIIKDLNNTIALF